MEGYNMSKQKIHRLLQTHGTNIEKFLEKEELALLEIPEVKLWQQQAAKLDNYLNLLQEEKVIASDLSIRIQQQLPLQQTKTLPLPYIGTAAIVLLAIIGFILGNMIGVTIDNSVTTATTDWHIDISEWEAN